MIRLILCLQIFLLSVLNAFGGVRYTTANLHLRYGPGTKYQVVTVIPKGTPVTIDEDCNCRWIAVEYCGNIGYVSSKYLSSRYHSSSSTVGQYRHSYSSTSYSHPTSRVRYYTNTYGNRVQSPTYYSSTPSGATAICRDGTYSFSQSRRGTCSHHGGVARWL